MNITEKKNFQGVLLGVTDAAQNKQPIVYQPVKQNSPYQYRHHFFLQYH